MCHFWNTLVLIDTCIQRCPFCPRGFGKIDVIFVKVITSQFLCKLYRSSSQKKRTDATTILTILTILLPHWLIWKHCFKGCLCFFLTSLIFAIGSHFAALTRHWGWIMPGLHKLWYPSIRDTSTWSKFGAHGEHGEVFLFSNLGALWFSENLIRYSLHICLREVKNNLFSFKHPYLRHFSWRLKKF